MLRKPRFSIDLPARHQLHLARTLRTQVQNALLEDIGPGDLTARLIDQSMRVHARLISRESACLCGQAWFEEVFLRLDPDTHIDWQVREGEQVAPGQVVVTLSGPARAILTGERTAMNFLQTLSGTATETRRYAEAIAGTGAVVMDTRKTIPGLRLAQKYAVLVGGGANQRIGLHDGILIKENHIAAAGGIPQALAAAAALQSGAPIQIEVENLTELRDALDHGAKLILLDNFSLTALQQAVELTAGHAILEASGNITLENIRAVAETGVNRISIGALTKHVRAVDLSLRLNEQP
jgi:nicotinate-nucleotide pyrophosphorylase (carboxylating)